MKRVLILLLLIVLLGSSALADTVVGDPSLTVNGKTITYQGQEYRLKKRVTTILVLGIDRWEEEYGESALYRNGGQSDLILLLIINDNAKTITGIQVNRDSMAEIKVLNVLGQETHTATKQICLAYSYGEGGATSCKLALWAVQKYLHDIPIDHYFAMSLDGISVLNDWLGGIEVTLEDDFTQYDPQMTKGTTLRLQGKQAEYFLRYRYGVGDSSNASRMARQRQYMEAAKEVLAERYEASTSSVLELFDVLADYSVTDMSRGYIINFANKGTKYVIMTPEQVEGESVLGEDGYMEFYADEDALMELILRELYEPV